MQSEVTTVRQGKNPSPRSRVILEGSSSCSPDCPGQSELLHPWASTSPDQPQGGNEFITGASVRSALLHQDQVGEGRNGRGGVVRVLIQVCPLPETRPGHTQAPTPGEVTEDSRLPTSPTSWRLLCSSHLVCSPRSALTSFW